MVADREVVLPGDIPVNFAVKILLVILPFGGVDEQDVVRLPIAMIVIRRVRQREVARKEESQLPGKCDTQCREEIPGDRLGPADVCGTVVRVLRSGETKPTVVVVLHPAFIVLSAAS